MQEDLLLSILPKHIADEMLQGMKNQAKQQEVQQQQFNTMYMYRHENVRSGSQNQLLLLSFFFWGDFSNLLRGVMIIVPGRFLQLVKCYSATSSLLFQYPVC